MRTQLPLTLIDQAILSAFTVGANLTLLSMTGPDEFGRFAYTLAATLIFTSLQNALVCTPIAVYVPASAGPGQGSLLGALWRIDVLCRIAACLAGLGVFALVDTGATYLSIATALLAASMWRETARATLFATSRFARCLALDAAAIAVTIAAAVALWQVIEPAMAVLAGMAIGNAAAVLGIAVRPRFGATATARAIRDYAAYWPEVRWSILGGATTEAQYRFYVFAVEGLRGIDALGIVQAGRVLMGPLTLSVTAWGRVARSAMARQIADGRVGEAAALLRNGLVLLAAAVLAWGLVLYIAWPYIDAIIFRDRYPGVEFLTLCWFAYTVINVYESAISVFVQAAREFRRLAYSSIAAASVSVVLLIGLTAEVPLAYAIGAVTAGEFIALCWTALLAIRIASRAGLPALAGTRAAQCR